MKLRLFIAVVVVLCAGVSSMRAGQQSGPTFNVAREAGSPDKFDLMISDGNEAVISGIFSKSQLQVFRNVLLEARKFAMSEEEAGKQQPKITRISSQSEPALFIDVSKTDDQSQLYITLSTESGHMTIEGGTVQRRLRREQGLFFILLSRVQALLPESPTAK